MNELTSIELLYESLVPVEKPGSMFLSVGTVTLLSDKELHLDFNNTLTAWFPLENAHVKLCTQLTDFEPRTFNEDYIRQGITAQDLTTASLLTGYMIPMLLRYIRNTTPEPRRIIFLLPSSASNCILLTEVSLITVTVSVYSRWQNLRR